MIRSVMSMFVRKHANFWVAFTAVVMLPVMMVMLSCETTTSVAVEDTEVAEIEEVPEIEEVEEVEAIIEEVVPSEVFAEGEVLGTVYFSAELARVSSSANTTIEAVAERVNRALADNVPIVVSVNGHTALAGTADGRAALSRRRAEMVVSRLRSLGVPAANVVTKSFGATQPAADNSSERGRSQNRRAVIVVQSTSQ